MGEVITIGLDIAKSVFQVHGVDEAGCDTQTCQPFEDVKNTISGGTIPKECRKPSFHDAMFGDEEWRVPTDAPAWIAHIEEGCAAYKEEIDASIALVSSENLSRAGALALLQYAMEVEAKDSECWPDELYDDNGKRRTWHFFLMEKIAGALDARGTAA